MVHQLTFERFEKTLRHRVVPAVTFSTHTLHHGQALQLIPEFSAGVLHTPIRPGRRSDETVVVPVWPCL